MVETQHLRLGIPKGSLQETTQKLFVRAGYDLRISGRSYYPDIDDPEIQCILIRPQEMARYVGQGILDCAITGLDWILETGADVAELADLRAPWPNYGVVRWVMASKEDSRFDTVRDLEGCRIATEAVGMTKRFMAEHGVNASVEFSWGATEVKPPILADAIVDVSETGSSLRANKLKVMHVVLESTPRFIAHRGALEDGWKKRQDGSPADDAQRSDRRRDARPAVDERAPREGGRRAAPAAGPRDANGLHPLRPGLGRSEHRRRGEQRAGTDSAPVRSGGARHHRAADQQDRRVGRKLGSDQLFRMTFDEYSPTDL